MNNVRKTKCYVCGAEIEDNGDKLQFCSGATCIFDYWKRLHRKYKTDKASDNFDDSNIVTGNDLMELRGQASVGIFSKVLHTRPQAINEAERMGAEPIPYPLLRKVQKYLEAELLELIEKKMQAEG